jgi:drug/metabolite transporter (DMT)-like permease
MQVLVTFAVLGSALLHAAWSAIAYRFRDQELGFAMLAWVSTGCYVVVLPFVPTPAPASRPYLAASVVLHVVYVLLLIRAYRVAYFSQAYPLSRGLSPVLVATVAVVFLGERLTPRQLVSLVLILAGLLLLAVARLGGESPNRGAIAAAASVSMMIASYSTIDGVGVRQAGTVLGYLAWLGALHCLLTALWLTARQRSRLGRAPRRLWLLGAAGGVMASVGYGLVVWAQAHGKLAVVAALRETSIVFAAAIGVLLFGEAAGSRRILAAGLVVAGIAMLRFSSS